MPLTLNQKIEVAALVVTALGAIAAWLVLPFGKWWVAFRRFLLRKLTPVSPRAEDFPGVRKAYAKTLEEIQLSLPSPLIEWLHDQDFGNGFWNKKLFPLLDFNWKHRGPEFEFLDKETESLRLILLGEIEKFDGLIGTYTVWGSDGWQRFQISTTMGNGLQLAMPGLIGKDTKSMTPQSGSAIAIGT